MESHARGRLGSCWSALRPIALLRSTHAHPRPPTAAALQRGHPERLLLLGGIHGRPGMDGAWGDLDKNPRVVGQLARGRYFWGAAVRQHGLLAWLPDLPDWHRPAHQRRRQGGAQQPDAARQLPLAIRCARGCARGATCSTIAWLLPCNPTAQRSAVPVQRREGTMRALLHTLLRIRPPSSLHPAGTGTRAARPAMTPTCTRNPAVPPPQALPCWTSTPASPAWTPSTSVMTRPRPPTAAGCPGAACARSPAAALPCWAQA